MPYAKRCLALKIDAAIPLELLFAIRDWLHSVLRMVVLVADALQSVIAELWQLVTW